jgi:GMP synthase (glutamine-hydrolysing)
VEDSVARKFAVFQHTPWEGPGKFLLKSTRRHCIELEIVQVWQQPIPDLSSYAGLIVLGGSPHVSQENIFPFLRKEKAVIKDWVNEGRPYLGFCLGLQLLAASLGAEVGNNFKTSIGFTQGYLTAEGRHHPVFSNMERRFLLFKWHQQTILPPIPKELSILATSSECQVEAVSMIDHPTVVGLQYDNHAADVDEVAIYLQNDQKWLASLTDQQVDPRRILMDAEIYRKDIEQQFESFFSNYLKVLNSCKMEPV